MTDYRIVFDPTIDGYVIESETIIKRSVSFCPKCP